MEATRKHLSAKGLLAIVQEEFKKITSPPPLAPRKNPVTLLDCLMSGLAVFGLKFSSLLQFDEARSAGQIKHNLQTLYYVKQAPSDTYMRERLDEVEPKQIRKTYKTIFAQAQRGKVLEEFEYLDGHYLLAGDGTGFFSSKDVHCSNCCTKQHNQCHIKFLLMHPNVLSVFKKNTYLLIKNPQQPWSLYFINERKKKLQIDISDVSGLYEILLEKTRKQLSKQDKETAKQAIIAYYSALNPNEEVSYYHNMFCAAIVHPNKKNVLPLAPEPIVNSDGSTKNDCEQNASKRLYSDARREHPHLKFIVVEDSIASNRPHLHELNLLNMRYIIGAKPGDHKFLFEEAKKMPAHDYEHQTENGSTHRYRYINGIGLSKNHSDFKVNFIEYWETNKKGKKQYFSWVTDIAITDDNVYQLMKGGRCNWKIENETFNTLKNQGYHFSHNFGHGYQHLCTVFGMLMMLAFFIDQVQELSCQLFKKARAKFKSRISLWEKIRRLFMEYIIESWEDAFNAIAHGHARIALQPNTS